MVPKYCSDATDVILTLNQQHNEDTDGRNESGQMQKASQNVKQKFIVL